MAQTLDLYSILQVPRNAPIQDIRSAYLRKAMEVHPDKNNEIQNQNLFQQIQQAYQILSEPKSRLEYDKSLLLQTHEIPLTVINNNSSIKELFAKENFFNSIELKRVREKMQGESQEEPPKKKQKINKLPPISELKTALPSQSMPNLMVNNQSILDNNSKSNLRQETNSHGVNLKSLASFGSLSSMVQSQTDISLTIQHVLKISFNESVTGCKKTIFFKRNETCNTCSSSPSLVSCNTCNGSKIILVEATLDVSIPAGVIDGCKKRVANEGNTSVTGRKGDLIVTVSVEAHPFLRRKNQLDVECDLPLSFVHATLGVTLQIPTISGTTRLQIPSGTQPFHIITIPNEGFVDYRNPSRKGNMYVKIVINIPKTITEKQRELLKEFEKESNNNKNNKN